MGLDISAYRNATNINAEVFDADGYPIDPASKEPLDYDVRIYANPDFPGREDGLVHRAFYTVDGSDSVDGRWGYGRYNRLRDELAKLAGYPVGQYAQYGRDYDSHCVACWNGAQGPFAELINFSDCEGVIGPVTSKKLAVDFAEFQSKADTHESEEFRDFYATMRQAFEVAAQGGLVHFH